MSEQLGETPRHLNAREVLDIRDGQGLRREVPARRSVDHAIE